MRLELVYLLMLQAVLGASVAHAMSATNWKYEHTFDPFDDTERHSVSMSFHYGNDFDALLVMCENGKLTIAQLTQYAFSRQALEHGPFISIRYRFPGEDAGELGGMMVKPDVIAVGVDGLAFYSRMLEGESVLVEFPVSSGARNVTLDLSNFSEVAQPLTNACLGSGLIN